jgi:benzoylformate decarboxylase
MATQGNRAIIEQFVADGFTHMFGNPGTVEQGFLDVLRDYGDLRYILGLQESVCVAMADGYARATNGPALVQLHSGVGLGNGIGMLYQAMRGHAPLVVVAGEAGLRYEALEAQMAVDLVAMARPVTKWAVRATDPGSVLRVLRRAVKTALTPPRGPVFVALPLDVLDAANDEAVLRTLVPHQPGAPAPELLAEAAALLAPARRPLVLIGDGVAAAGAQDQVAALAERWGAAVWDVDGGEMNIDARHPLYRGQLGHMFGRVSTAVVGEADAVLIVGTYVFPEVFPDLDSPFRPGTPVVHLDLDSGQIARNHPVDLGLVGDPAAGLAALERSLADAMSAQAALAARGRTEAARGSVRHRPPAPDTLADRFFAAVARTAPDDLVLFDEALTASPTLNRHLPARRPKHWFQTRGGSLGVGIPGALGVQLAMPGKTVLAVTGDGGSMYTIQALAAAARYRLGVKFVVCNNGRYRLLDDNLAQYRSERGLGQGPLPEAFDLAPQRLGFVEIARGQGVEAVRVEHEDQIGPAVERMFADPAPFLVDLATGAPTEGSAP